MDRSLGLEFDSQTSCTSKSIDSRGHTDLQAQFSVTFLQRGKVLNSGQGARSGLTKTSLRVKRKLRGTRLLGLQTGRERKESSY